MSQLSFDHLLNLSFAWHLRRKTGEIMRLLDRGQAINRTLEVNFKVIFLLFLLRLFTVDPLQCCSYIHRYSYRARCFLHLVPMDPGAGDLWSYVRLWYSHFPLTFCCSYQA